MNFPFKWLENVLAKTSILLEEDLKYEEQYMTLDTMNLYYNKYTILVYSQDSLKVKKTNADSSFLYSDRQNIMIQESQTAFDITFNYIYSCSVTITISVIILS